jgi:lipopolysaccharide/colanic/teichoic acid biosynthesis glycosyltransferase
MRHSLIRGGGMIAKRVFDAVVAALALLVLAPVFLAVAVAVKCDSRGSVFYRCRRVGFGGREFAMLKFRKMRADAAGLPLTLADDERFTRVGQLLARTKLDELPQLWNVLRGEMSLVGPRPEDPEFVALVGADYEQILAVRPGVTGLCQLAFARESEILDREDRFEHYVQRLLPQKVQLDRLYADRRSFRLDLQILYWTLAAVVLRREVAVNRASGRLGVRRRPRVVAAAAGGVGFDSGVAR